MDSTRSVTRIRPLCTSYLVPKIVLRVLSTEIDKSGVEFLDNNVTELPFSLYCILYLKNYQMKIDDEII